MEYLCKMKFNFHSLTELLDILKAEQIDLAAYALKRELFLSGQGEEAVLAELDRRIAVTRASIDRGIAEAQYSKSGLVKGSAAAYHAAPARFIHDDLYNRTITYALAVNEVSACGGKIVAFPTAGSSGIVPGTIWAWIDSRSLPDAGRQTLLRAAFFAAAITGALIAQRADLAGAEGGCQAECGAAGAMAACALSLLEKLSVEQCFSAAALSLKNSLGLCCDPVAGLVEVPCVKRNAFVAVNALTAVSLTLAGIERAIPFDEVVMAMKQIGDSMPASLKETSGGGLARSPTAQKVVFALSA
jgi:L-serine dehydratase